MLTLVAFGSTRRVKGKVDDGPNTPVYIAVIGKHGVVLLPEKSGQPGQSIGLATIFQTFVPFVTLVFGH